MITFKRETITAINKHIQKLSNFIIGRIKSVKQTMAAFTTRLKIPKVIMVIRIDNICATGFIKRFMIHRMVPAARIGCQVPDKVT
jgi:hypothetical protein